MGKYIKTLLLSIAFVIVTLGLIPTQAMAKTNIEYEVIKGDTLVISATGEGDIPSREIHYYEEDKMTKTTLSGNIVLKPIWVKYKVKNVKKQAIKIMIDDSDSVVSFGIFDIRYS